jgi:pyruvate/2-oxoglutarate dehydrogenase complex dihydrolipoamide acyltransferase (E2) component
MATRASKDSTTRGFDSRLASAAGPVGAIVGGAVGTDKGLVVPVVRDCDRLDLAGIEKMIAGLGKRARAGELKIEEMQGGTSPKWTH